METTAELKEKKRVEWIEKLRLEEVAKAERRAKREVARLERERLEAIRVAEIRERKLASTPKIVSLQELLFPVKIRDEELDSNSEYKKRVIGLGIGNDGSDKLLNQCSPRYELYPNAEIFPKIEQVLIANEIEYEVTYTHIGNVKFFADYRITDDDYSHTIKGTGDKIQPMLRVQHSYNGLVKYKIIFGYFRIICENGLVLPIEEMKKYNLVITGKHTESIKKSFVKLNSLLVYFSAEADTITKEITANYEKLASNKVTDLKARLEEVLKASKINAVENARFNTINDIILRIEKEMNHTGLGYNGKVNDWLIYNGINQYLNDNNRNIISPEKRMETDSKVLEYMLKNVA